MIAILFDVNNGKLRKDFFDQVLIDSITPLTESSKANWGKMTPQNMIEHLIWAFECSTGILEVPCNTPEKLLERAKRFLYNNNPTPMDFKHPLLGENPPPLRFQSFAGAMTELSKENARFIDYFLEHPGSVTVHPIFGPLGAEEWQRSHYKHCYHHLLQFGLIGQS
jgi:oxepin-CoA hydrolase / 3-oxo-5,6-dehydrosuberyl-CoA semialdehyde dehydrogenase